MTTPQFKRLGALYKAIGLATNPELVNARLGSAQKAYKALDSSHLVPLTRGALKLAKSEELGFLVEALADGDAGFDSNGGNDAEVAAVAAATLWEMIEGRGELAGPAALAVTTAAFGGVRTYVDPELAGFAATSLAAQQREVRPGPTQATYRSKPALKEDLDALDTHGQNGDFGAGSPHLRKLLEGGINYTANGLSDLALQLQRVIEHQARLEEEMNIHWWLVGGWSRDVDKPFADLDLGRAALLAANELADLTKTDIGLASAPALLDMVLVKGRKGAPKALSMADLVLATPIADRRAWTDELLADMAAASLVPLCFAAALAADGDDAEDWKPRFQRLSGIDPSLAVKPLDAANQLYRELLLRREIG